MGQYKLHLLPSLENTIVQTPGSRATRNVYGKLIVACLNQIQTLFKKTQKTRPAGFRSPEYREV